MNELRDYQSDLINRIEKAIAKGHRRIMVQLPTGGGKTRCFVELIKQNRLSPYLNKENGCLVIAHRKELIEQAEKSLKAEIGTVDVGWEINIIKSKHERDNQRPNSTIQIASVQTLIRRQFPKAGLVIIDEAHHATAKSYTTIMLQYPEAVIIGVTATPARTDGTGFRKWFDILIEGASIKDLTQNGYLCPYKLFAYAKQRIDLKGVDIVAGDYNLDQLAESVRRSKVHGDLIETWEKHAKGKRTVVFAVNVALSKEYADLYKQAGYQAEHVDGSMKEIERSEIISRFKEGKTQILCNCNIVTEGFDLPEMECVQIVRPTKSLILWLQMIGRSLRYADGKCAIILDHTENWKRLGMPDATRNWSLDGVKFMSGLGEAKDVLEGQMSRDIGLDHREGELIEVSTNLLIRDTPMQKLELEMSIISPNDSFSEKLVAVDKLLTSYCNGERNFVHTNLENANLSGVNLEDADLSGANLKKANLSSANLSGANLKGANLSNANLSGANLGMSDNYKTVNLCGANLESANLFGAELPFVFLDNFTNLSNANLFRVKLSNAFLKGVNFSNANLSGANLKGANLSNANLSGANIQRANFSNANLSGANLKGLNLFGVIFSGADLERVNLSNADLSSINLQRTNLSNANLSGANLKGLNLSRGKLFRANLRGANLSNANLSGANLNSANLSGANLSGANLRNANLYCAQDVDFSGVLKMQCATMPNGSIASSV